MVNAAFNTQSTNLVVCAGRKGGAVLAMAKDPRDSFLWVALVELPPSQYVAAKYVTWGYNAQDDGFFSGHYFEAVKGEEGDGASVMLRKAFKDFAERSRW